MLSGPESFRIFDTDFPHGALAGYFPASARIVDFSKTQGQVRLFDTVLGEPDHDYIVDLDASMLWRFFQIYRDIGFDRAAADKGITVTVYFFIDRSLTSVEALAKVSKMIDEAGLIAVRNEMIGNVLTIPRAAAVYQDIPKTGEIQLPRLSVDALNHIDAPAFTFSDFIAHNGANTLLELRIEIWNFLETVYNQVQPDGR